MDDGAPPIPPRPPGYETLIPVTPSSSSSAAGDRPPLPPRQPSGSQRQSQSQSQYQYQYQSQYQSQVPPPPPPQQQYQPPPPPPPRQQYQQPPQQQYQQFQQPSPGAGAVPPPPPQSPQVGQQQPQSGRVWQHLFYPDGSPKAMFVDLMASFFVILDPQRTGYLTPEVFSSWLDVNETQTEHNVWKNYFKPMAMFEPVDQADYEFKAVLEAWRFDHRVVQRGPPGRRTIPYGGMPLLSLKGFVDYMAVEVAGGPVDDACSGLNAALRHYGVWPELGPLPRWALPAEMPAEVKARVDAANARSRRNADEKLDALHAKHLIEAKGRQQALELLSDYRYVYRPI